MTTWLPLDNLPLFIAAALALLLVPGPSVLYIVTRSVDQGRTAGLVSVLGIQTATLVHASAAALGLSAILLSSALLFDLVKYLGAAYLIYLGIRKWMSRDEALTTAAIAAEPLKRIYAQGVIVNLLNPKTALFFFAFLPQFADPGRGFLSLQILSLGIVFILLALLTDGSYALLSSSLSGWLRGNQRFAQVQRYITGTVYIGLGVTAALTSRGKN